jgi:hypothetical protein
MTLLYYFIRAGEYTRLDLGESKGAGGFKTTRNDSLLDAQERMTVSVLYATPFFL